MSALGLGLGVLASGSGLMLQKNLGLLGAADVGTARITFRSGGLLKTKALLLWVERLLPGKIEKMASPCV